VGSRLLLSCSFYLLLANLPLDNQLGNWRTFGVTTGGTVTLSQSRTHDAGNKIANPTPSNAITESGGQAAWIDPAYDGEGNQTSGPVPGSETTRQHYVYDAWNRMVKVQADDGNGNPAATLGTYHYDGLGRRVSRAVSLVTTRYDYYNVHLGPVGLKGAKRCVIWQPFVW
jgi:YD repeat-containing protein